MGFNFTKTQFEDQFASKKATVLFKEVKAAGLTPTVAGLKIFESYPDYHFLLESADEDRGRFSVIGADPDQVFRCKNKVSFLNENFAGKRDDFRAQNGDPLENFRAFFKESEIDFGDLNYRDEALPGVAAGVFGYFGYDMVKLMERSLFDANLRDEIDLDEAIFMRPRILVIFDNKYDVFLICAPVFRGCESGYDEISERINEIESTIRSPITQMPAKRVSPSPFTSNFSKKEYEDVVKRCQKYIGDGDIFQVIPSQRFSAKFDKSVSEFEFYKALRELNPSPFLFFFRFEDFVLTGSSPEIMVSLKNNKVTVRPLAGTRKRGATKQEDDELAKDLLSDEKETAEHLMLIDLGRHDVGRVCKPGTVELTQKMVIERYSHVMHISSNVEGEIRDDLDALDALISGFPAGTVSGAPKIRALEIIEEIEKDKRGFYAGCTGYFSSNGEMETCINLRTALIKDGKIYLQAGAGVVFDSDPESEYFECINKARALMRSYENISDQQTDH